MMIMEQRRRYDSKKTTNTRPSDTTIHPNSKETWPDGPYPSANNQLRYRIRENNASMSRRTCNQQAPA